MSMPITSPPAGRSRPQRGPSTCSRRRPTYRFRSKGVRDGDVLPLGNVSATVLHTPGHTPEHICILVTDRTRANEPWFVLTGHTLMVGDLGRTELAASAEEGASAPVQSVRRLKELPDHVEVLPGAYAGSVCGRRLSGKPSSTIGFEKRHNRRSRSRTKPSSFGSWSPKFRRRRRKPRGSGRQTRHAAAAA